VLACYRLFLSTSTLRELEMNSDLHNNNINFHFEQLIRKPSVISTVFIPLSAVTVSELPTNVDYTQYDRPTLDCIK
jgi:hypothetical protein